VTSGRSGLHSDDAPFQLIATFSFLDPAQELRFAKFEIEWGVHGSRLLTNVVYRHRGRAAIVHPPKDREGRKRRLSRTPA